MKSFWREMRDTILTLSTASAIASIMLIFLFPHHCIEFFTIACICFVLMLICDDTTVIK